MTSRYDYIFKYILLGDPGCGKTSLLNRLMTNDFATSYEATIGVEYGTKTLSIKDKRVKLAIWDTAGQEAFKSIIRSYYKTSIGVMLCFDITNRESFRHVMKWYQGATEECHEATHYILIGMKSDLTYSRTVGFDEAHKFATENNMSYIEISSKTSHNTSEAFEILANNICDSMESKPDLFKNINLVSPFTRYSTENTVPIPSSKTSCCTIL